MKVAKWIFCLGLTFNVVEGFAASPKAAGMGNTGVAYPQDALSSEYNPANAVWVGTRFDGSMGVSYSPYRARVKGNANPRANERVYGRRTWAPVSAMGFNKQMSDDFAVGFLVDNRVFTKTHYNKPNALAGTREFGKGYELYTASFIASKRWGCHSIGLSLDILVGRYKSIGLQNFDNPTFTVAPGHVTQRGYDWNWGIGISAGWLWNVTDTFSLGLTFRPETKMSRFHKYKGFIPKRGIVHNVQSIAAGLSWRFLPCATFCLDASYVWARRLRGVKNPLVKDPIAVKLGSKHGSAFGLRNPFFINVGFDYAFNEKIILRTGYIFARETIRRSQVFFNTIHCAPIQHFFTFGSTYAWSDKIELTFFYVHGFDRALKRKNGIPVIFGGGDVSLGRSLDVVAFAMGMKM